MANRRCASMSSRRNVPIEFAIVEDPVRNPIPRALVQGLADGGWDVDVDKRLVSKCSACCYVRTWLALSAD